MGAKKKIQDEGEIHSLEHACYHAVHAYPGAVRGVAGVFGWNLARFQNKVNPSEPGHKLNVHEVEEILRLTKDPRILTALGAVAGVVWLPAGQVSAIPGDLDVLERGNDVLCSSTALINELVKALADGEIDQVEMGRIQKRAFELQQGMAGVVETAKQFEREAGDE